MSHIIRGNIYGNKSSGDYTEFENDGSQRFFGKASMWDDLRVPVTSTRRGGSKDPDFTKILDNGSGSQGVFAEMFSPSVEEEVYFACQIPHAWVIATNVNPHVHWVPTANGTSGQRVNWGMEYGFAEIGEVFGNTVIIYGNTSIPDETIVEKRHYLTELPEIDLSTATSVSSMFLCRIFRDATGTGGIDNYGSDVALMEFDFHIQKDAMGSRQEYVK